MPLHKWSLFSVLTAALFVSPAFCTVAAGDDFCIESKVFHNGQLVSTSTTMFQAGLVYDFLSEPSEITLYDPQRKRFVLLDLTRKTKTEITTEQIAAFSTRLQTEAARSNREIVKFLARPQFDEQFDRGGDELVLNSRWMKYRVKTAEATNADTAQQYADFVKWQTQLNAMTPGSSPPFARMAVNEALNRRGLLPVHVELTRYQPSRSEKPATLSAEHRIQWRLLESDRRRIDQANQCLATFGAVTLDQYHQAAE